MPASACEQSPVVNSNVCWAPYSAAVFTDTMALYICIQTCVLPHALHQPYIQGHEQQIWSCQAMPCHADQVMPGHAMPYIAGYIQCFPGRGSRSHAVDMPCTGHAKITHAMPCRAKPRTAPAMPCTAWDMPSGTCHARYLSFHATSVKTCLQETCLKAPAPFLSWQSSRLQLLHSLWLCG